ncbi:MAG: hypothetical protein ABIL86_09895 [candidate division WOR-3 bacterium]
MRLSSLFKPRYLFYRIRGKLFEIMHPEVPWLGNSAILFLDNWLKPSDIGFEWGSGRSTIWIGRKVKHLISIEDKQDWYIKIKEEIAINGLNGKIDLRFIPCELKEQDEPESHPYADIILNYPDAYFDFILIDRNIRSLCMERAIEKIKQGGLLILDNANRYIPNRFLNGFSTVHEPRDYPRSTKWAQIIEQLKDWRWINTSDGIWDTRFWIKV